MAHLLLQVLCENIFLQFIIFFAISQYYIKVSLLPRSCNSSFQKKGDNLIKINSTKAKIVIDSNQFYYDRDDICF